MAISPAVVIPTVSLGRVSAGHKLLHKLEVAAKHGYAGVELTFECLADLAEDLASSTTSTTATRREKLHVAAQTARKKADELGLRIFVLQPFGGFEGLIEKKVFEEKLVEAELWVSIARILGADVVQVPCNALGKSECSGSQELIVSHLQKLADLGRASTSSNASEQTIRFAYENLEWGTHLQTWQQAIQIVDLVNRPNFGFCLDTFHIAGLLYGNPSAVGGRRPGGEQALKESLEDMRQNLDVSKIFLFQLSDATLLDPPLPQHPFFDPSQRPGLTWSRNARPFPCTSGYLPVEEVAKVVYEMGYNGISSLEVFMPDHHQKKADVPDRMAELGVQSWRALVEKLDLK